VQVLTGHVATTGIVFRPSAEPLYQVRNMTRMTLYVRQASEASGFVVAVAPLQTVPYRLPQPSEPPTLRLQVGALAAEDEYELRKARSYPIFRARTADRTWVLVWPRIVLERGSWVLEVREVHGALSDKLAGVASAPVSRGVLAALQGWTARLDLSGLSVSLVGAGQEVAHAALRSVAFRCAVGQEELTASLSVRGLQMDNCLPNPIYPVVVQSERKGTVLTAKVQLALGSDSVSMINCLEVSAKPLRINLDKAFISHMLLAIEELFAREQQATFAASVAPDFMRTSLKSPQLFVRELIIDPMDVTLSYTPADDGQASKRSALHVALFEGFRLDYLRDVSELNLKLGSFALVNFQAARTELLDQVVSHFKNEVLAEWAKLLMKAVISVLCVVRILKGHLRASLAFSGLFVLSCLD
jgi:hypothetical protein